jgi:hypothetical protein
MGVNAGIAHHSLWVVGWRVLAQAHEVLADRIRQTATKWIVGCPVTGPAGSTFTPRSIYPTVWSGQPYCKAKLVRRARISYKATVSALQSCPRTRTKSSKGGVAAWVERYIVRRCPTLTFWVTDSRRDGRRWQVGISPALPCVIDAGGLDQLRDQQRIVGVCVRKIR